MYKKCLLFTALFSLAACSFSSTQQSPIPAEFAGADYQLSDAQAKRWVSISNQMEKCIYPNLTRIQQEHFSKEDAFIYSQYVFFYPLEEIIGSDNLKLIQHDQASMDYVSYQRKKFKNTEFKPLDEEKCAVLRKQARDDLAVVKGEYRSAMTEETPTKTENSQSLEKSKFSFDILKWGIGLMLL